MTGAMQIPGPVLMTAIGVDGKPVQVWMNH